jgi:hypothetical protein
MSQYRVSSFRESSLSLSSNEKQGHTTPKLMNFNAKLRIILKKEKYHVVFWHIDPCSGAK